jgi:hypothetical protein
MSLVTSQIYSPEYLTRHHISDDYVPPLPLEGR